MGLKSSSQEESSPSRFFGLRSSRPFILTSVCVAIFNDVFLFGTIIPVLPYALPHRINVDDQDVQILISILLAAYGGALLVGSLVFGWIGDRLPRRHAPFLFGLVMLLVATAFLSFGRQIAILVIGRILQGLSAALVWTSGLALLTDFFGQQRYGEAVGYTQTAVSIGTTAAPLLGGVVYSQGGYSAVCAMSMATVALSVVLALAMVEPKAQTGWEDQPSFTPEVAAKGNTNPIAASGIVSRMAQYGKSLMTIEASTGLVDERSALIQKDPGKGNIASQPVYFLLLRSGRILTAMWGIFTFAFVIISFEAMIPLFVKDTFSWDSARAALIFLSWIIPGFLGPIAGKAADRWKSGWIPVGGFLFIVPPLLLMRFVTEDNTLHKALLCVLLTLVGLGLVWIIPYCVSDLSAAATDLKREYPHEFGASDGLALAFGLYIFSYSCGFLVGPTLAGVIKAKASWGAATIVLASACVVACIPFLCLMRSQSR